MHIDVQQLLPGVILFLDPQHVFLWQQWDTTNIFISSFAAIWAISIIGLKDGWKNVKT